MTRKYNFGAGPAALPLPVLEEIREELLDWKGLGLSVMEISHRSDEFMNLASEGRSDFIQLLKIPEEYCVLFLHGGATLQMAMIPLNFSQKEGQAEYVNSGYWAQKAIKEARKFIQVNIAASSETSNFNFFPPQKSWQIQSNSSYIHITPNETIGGIRLANLERMDLPIIADYSSGILSGPLNVGNFGVIYGGAQKNIGPAGLGFAVIRKDLLDNVQDRTPTMLNYQTYFEHSSLYNTPSTFSWYVTSKVLKWLLKLGGLEKVSTINHRKAKKLYSLIDNSDFYKNNIQESSRSIMNIPFSLEDESLNLKFLEDASKAGLLALKGHRSVGGMRASIYNAMPEEGVDSLIDFMTSFEKENF